MVIGLAVFTVAAVLLFFVSQASQGAKLSTAVEQTRRTGSPEPVVEFVTAAPEERRPTHWDDALGQLWQAYARVEAARLVMAAARRSDATILQYWIKRVLEVEPRIADEVFTESFLAAHYRPRVADRCGKSGCCG